MPLDRRKTLLQMSDFPKVQFYHIVILFICCLPCFPQTDDLQDPTLCPVHCTCSFNQRSVNCSNRSLRKVPTPIPLWVEILSFRNNKIPSNEIRSKLLNRLHVLEYLDFSDNRISNINISLRNLPRLKTLLFDRCSLGEIPIMRCENGLNVTKLSLSRNSIHSIKDNLKFWPFLITLDLSHNRIRYLSNNSFLLQNNLTTLNLCKNKIATIELEAFAGLNSLQTLVLARNRIRDLKNLTRSQMKSSNKPCMGHLRSLKYLDLSRNHISKLDGLTFQGMCQLQTLLLSDNNIASLNDGAFFSLKALTVLEMNNNFIKSVTKKWLFDLESLHSLSLSHNNVSSIESSGWSFCERLKYLNLSHNRIPSLLTATFQPLQQLVELDLSHNAIVAVQDKAFDGLTSLRSLNLSYNEISSSVEDINGAFYGLGNLKVLFLNNNKIRSLTSETFRGADGLTSLHLEQNNITSIENNTFLWISSLKDIHINSTSMLCDCQLTWLSKWLRFPGNSNMTSTVQARCFYPAQLKGRFVEDVLPHEFECGKHPVPALLQQPSLLTSYKGENVTLECSASATLTSGVNGENVKMDAEWRKGPANTAVKESRSIRIRNRQHIEGGHIFFSSLLLLYQVDYHDEDVYSCFIRNHFGHIKSTPARLKVVSLPRIIMQPVNKTVKFGSEVVVGCQASGHPLPEISWEKADGSTFAAAEERRLVLVLEDDQSDDAGDLRKSRLRPFRIHGGGLSPDPEPTNPQERRKTVQDRTKIVPLHIRDVKPVDAGKYKCTAKSDAGVESAYVTIVVFYPPRIELMPDEAKAIIGGNAVLKCMADAHPPPEIVWSLDNLPLLATARHFFAADGRLLVIVDARPGDEGLYTCSVSNRLGLERRDIRLDLVYSLNDTSNEGGILEALQSPLGILVAVFVLVVAVSLACLIVLCYSRKTNSGSYSTSTDSSDFPMDSSSHDSLDNSLLPHHAKPISHMKTPSDLLAANRRYCCAPDLLTATCRPNPSYDCRSFPRNPRLDSAHIVNYSPAHSGVFRRDPPSNTDTCMIFEKVQARPPFRAVSTSHMYNIPADHRMRRSAHSISEASHGRMSLRHTTPRRPVTSQSKRRRRTKRATDSTDGQSSKQAYSSTSDSENDKRSLRSRLSPQIADEGKSLVSNATSPVLSERKVLLTEQHDRDCEAQSPTIDESIKVEISKLPDTAAPSDVT